MFPALLAEADRDAYRRSRAALAREEWAMEGVDGWKVGAPVYEKEGTKRHVPPATYIA